MVIHFALFPIGGLSGGIQLPRGVVLRFPHPERTWARKAPRTSSSPLLPPRSLFCRIGAATHPPCRSGRALRDTTQKAGQETRPLLVGAGRRSADLRASGLPPQSFGRVAWLKP